MTLAMSFHCLLLLLVLLKMAVLKGKPPNQVYSFDEHLQFLSTLKPDLALVVKVTCCLGICLLIIFFAVCIERGTWEGA